MCLRLSASHRSPQQQKTDIQITFIIQSGVRLN